MASRVSTNNSGFWSSNFRLSGPARPDNDNPGLQVRREIRSLPLADQDRFMDAVLQMMQNVNGPQTSEYFRIAGYHGWPGGFCAHGVEIFPAWHRAYLKEFETALQAADRQLGRDGSITLPYWDWTNTNYPDVIPAILRRRLPQLPSGLISQDTQLTRTGYRLASDRRLRELIVTNGLLGANGLVSRALLERTHWRHASSENTRSPSIETPHNLIHVYCGYPMNVVDFAAFHPIFFLHHCNIDRLYDAYLRANPDSQEEMARHQLTLLSGRFGGWVNPNDANRPPTLFEQPLQPFRRPDGRWYTPGDMFNTAWLGYTYDSLPALAPQQLNDPPTLALFEKVDVAVALASKSFILHVFVLSEQSIARWLPPDNLDDLQGSPGYAGSTAVFGGKGRDCENCVAVRKPVTVEVDVTSALRTQGLSRWQAHLRVVVEDEMGQLLRLEDTPVPAPVLVGPYWEDPSSVPLTQGAPPGDTSDAVYQGLVQQLQRALEKFGYYQAGVDGDFGPITDAAVRRLQAFLGLKVDGIVGPITKGAVLRPRFDLEDDKDEVLEDTPVFSVAQSVKWWLGLPPGYLDTAAVKQEVVRAFCEWAEVVPLFFSEVDSPAAADLRIQWDEGTPDNLFRFDGPGGSLAYTQSGTITLDESERWLLQGQDTEPGAFYLLPVLLHELGHGLGLSHSNSSQDVMAPYYEPGKVRLAFGDQERAVALYPLEAEYAKVFRILDRDGDGLLSRDELMAAVTQAASSPLSVGEAETLWSEATGGGQHSVDLKRFLELMSRYFFGNT